MEPSSKASLGGGQGGRVFHIQSLGGREKGLFSLASSRGKQGTKGQFVFSPTSGMFSWIFLPSLGCSPSSSRFELRGWCFRSWGSIGSLATRGGCHIWRSPWLPSPRGWWRECWGGRLASVRAGPTCSLSKVSSFSAISYRLDIP